MAYRLYYWNRRGRAEQIRLLLAELGQPWEEVHVSGDSFAALKARGPSKLYFGSVPMLEDDEFSLCQAPVILSYLARKHGAAPTDPALAAKADAIAWGAEDLRIKYFGLFGGDDAHRRQEQFSSGPFADRWLPNISGLLEISGTGFFVGDQPSHADLAMWDVLDSMKAWVGGVSFDSFPIVAGFFDAIAARPGLAEYLASDRRPSG